MGALAGQRKSIGKLAFLQAHISQACELYAEITKKWTELDIPLNHQIKFIEAIQELKFEVMNQVIAKEIQDMAQNRSQIELVSKAINAREECINQIRRLDAAEAQKQKEAESTAGENQLYLPAQSFLSEMATLIQNLRQLSIHVVE